MYRLLSTRLDYAMCVVQGAFTELSSLSRTIFARMQSLDDIGREVQDFLEKDVNSGELLSNIEV